MNSTALIFIKYLFAKTAHLKNRLAKNTEIVAFQPDPYKTMKQPPNHVLRKQTVRI